jgi:hypothetical protein
VRERERIREERERYQEKREKRGEREKRERENQQIGLIQGKPQERKGERKLLTRRRPQSENFIAQTGPYGLAGSERGEGKRQRNKNSQQKQ